MARTDTTEGQTLWQPGRAEDSHYREGGRHLRLVLDEEGEDSTWEIRNRSPYLPLWRWTPYDQVTKAAPSEQPNLQTDLSKHS